jgi:glycosyltransferase involved in cell wall biosynthesis
METTTPRDAPFVSVVIPMLNEEKYITQCLDSLVRQDYPQDRYEVLVIDGDSMDASPALVAQMRQQHPVIRLIKNPQRAIPKALNLGLSESRGEIFARMDAHSLAPPEYLKQCVKYLLETGADNVGGILKVAGAGYWGKSIAMGTSCPFGVGNSKFRYSQEEDFTQAGFPGAFWKKTLLSLGGYDESFVINEDDVLNFRLMKKERKIFRTPKIAVTYFCRNALSKLWKQYFRYGFWKVKVIKKHGGPASIRHLIPAGFVASLIATGIAGFFFKPAVYLLAFILASYLTIGLAFAFRFALKTGMRYFFSLPMVFATLHLSYGTGFLLGLPTFLLFEKPYTEKVASRIHDRPKILKKRRLDYAS